MATVVGTFAKSAQIDDLRSNQSINIWDVDSGVLFEGWGRTGAIAGPLIDTQPISEAAVAVVGYLANSMSGNSVFYNRILITPTLIQLGNLLSAQTREITIWNGFGITKTLTNFQVVGGDGLLVTPPSAPPFDIPSYQEVVYTLAITTNGPPVIDATLTWTISGEDYTAQVLGRRVVVFPFGPNWANGYTESLEWRTDVLRSFNGEEQRRALRVRPRRAFEWRMQAKGGLAQLFDNLLWGWQNRIYATPVWSDKPRLNADQTLGDLVLTVDTPTYSFAVGGLAMLFEDARNYEVVEISGITGTTLQLARPIERNWPADTIVYPTVIGNLANAVPVQRYTGGVLQAAISFQSSPVDTDPYTPSAAAPASYLGLDVLTRQPNWIRPLDNTSNYAFDILDQITGAIQVDPTEDFPRIMRRYSWLLTDRASILAFRELLHRLRGQAKTLWIPSWHLDFTVIAPIPDSATTIDVVDNGFALMVGIDVARSHVCLRTEDGHTYYREITDVQQQTGFVRLVVSPALDVAVPLANIRALHVLMRNRLATDKVDINWRSNEVAVIETTFTSVLE
jgi:hypothetical protein